MALSVMSQHARRMSAFIPFNSPQIQIPSPVLGRGFAAGAARSAAELSGSKVAPPAPPPPSFVASLFQAPPMALLLGFSGLAPFVGLTPPVAEYLLQSGAPLPVSMALDPGGWQKTYGTCILSFLGGVHWGAAIQGGTNATSARLLWSVVPSLLAWPAVALPTPYGSAVLAGSLALAHGVDMRYARAGLFPPWYAGLRLPLTSLAVVSLITTSMLTSNHPWIDKKIKQFAHSK